MNEWPLGSREEFLNSPNLSTKTAYSIGQLAEGLKNTTFAFFLLFYYNQVLGVSGTLCGIALAIAIVLDAVTDPVMGAISDGWRSRWGRRHPFMYFAALPMAVCFYLTLFPMVESEMGLFVWLTCFAALTRLATTAFAVPYFALGAEMTSDYKERTSIVAGRTIFGMLGMFVVLALGFGWFFAASDEFPNGQLDPAAYSPFAAVVAVMIFVSIIMSAAGTHHLIPELQSPATREGWSFKQLLRDIASAAENASFRWLVGGLLIMAVPVGSGMSLTVYLNTFFWDVSPGAMGIVLAAMSIGSVIGLFAVPLVARYVEKREALIFGSLGWATFAILPVCLHYAGLFPAPGSKAVVTGLVACSFMAGLVSAQVLASAGSMIADVADEQELATNQRQEGVFYGAYVFSLKLTEGVGAVTGGLALELIRWPTGEHIKTALDIPPDSLFWLSIIAGPAMAIGFIPAAWCFSHYRLDEGRHRAILAELENRSQEPASLS